MLPTLRCLLSVSVLLGASMAVADDHDLESVDKAPEGLSPAIEKLLDPKGYQITGDDEPVIEMWLLKSLAVKPKFKPNFTQMYPFTPGQLIGAIRVAEDVEYADFRGQAIKAGVYTLRYGLQPMDGNHVGTSETSDFLLALPAKHDMKPEVIKGFDELSERSAKSAGSTHPAIFSLLDPKKVKKAKLEHDDFTEHWILSVVGKGKDADKDVDVKVRLVVVGQSEG